MNTHSPRFNPEKVEPALRPTRLMQTLAYIGEKWNLLKPRYSLAKWERTIRSRYAGHPKVPRGAPVVVIQCVEDIFYLCLFGEIIAALRRDCAIRVEQIVPRGMRTPAEGTGLRYLFRTTGRLLSYNRLTDWKWTYLFGAYADGIAYRCARKYSPWRELSIAAAARKLWKELTSKDDLIAMEVRGIPIGDLVADTYLRMRPSPGIRLEDPYLYAVIKQALRDLDGAFTYFGKKQPALFLTSYTSYIHHGIAARVAVFLGVRVQSFGNYQDFSKKITFDSAHHQREFTHYRRDFLLLKNQEEKIARAGAMLGDRLRGRIDDGVVYMKASSYGNDTHDIPDVRNAVVIFLHDFYDSPHAYSWMLFHDFWEWICFTIETLRSQNIPFFLKQHPNEVSESAADVARLVEMYPGLQLLPGRVSNLRLVEGGMSCAVTVYGSVAAEMAYLGIPTISSADNPHISFDFGITARTKGEYRSLLLNHARLPRDIEKMRREAGAFYYMQFLNLSPDDAFIRDKFVSNNVKMIQASLRRSWDAADILKNFRDLSDSPGFRKFIAGLRTILIEKSVHKAGTQAASPAHSERN